MKNHVADLRITVVSMIKIYLPDFFFLYIVLTVPIGYFRQ